MMRDIVIYSSIAVLLFNIAILIYLFCVVIAA